MEERYPGERTSDNRKRRLGRAALGTTVITVSIALGSAGGYGLAKLVTDVLTPTVEHAANSAIDSILGDPTTDDPLLTPQTTPESTPGARKP